MPVGFERGLVVMVVFGCIACGDDSAHGADASGIAGSVTDASMVDGALPDGSSAPDSSGASVPEECRSQCELAAGSCDEIPFDQFPTYEETHSEWGDSCESYLFAVAGTCADGSPLLYYNTGFTFEQRFYDSKGNFRGLTTGTDVVEPVCQGESYWPEVVRCVDPVTTEVLCGKSSHVGDPIDTSRWVDSSK